MAGGRSKRRMMSEINVVPYIDVMLVLLIIFMVTAPLLTQGVKVNLPNASARPLDLKPNETPVVLTVTADGKYYLNIGAHPNQPIDAKLVVATVAAVLKLRPGTHVVVRGDRDARYEQIMYAMVLLQRAGAPSVGMETNPNNPPQVKITGKS
ncbi:MAG: protein TolR [Gammaproteobacteria bacterium]|nr:protein TolR [Gammaproteobacteria bacterium]MDE2345946.1 protein TolR [Gammaproteobacteria bacterium]